MQVIFLTCAKTLIIYLATIKIFVSLILNYLISLNHYDYFVLTESWLTNDINSNELGMSNYRIFYNDRNNLNSIYSRGGGVLIDINNRFYFIKLNLS